MPLILTPVLGIPRVEVGNDLAGLIAAGLERGDVRPQAGDILVVCQKVVSKAEGRIARLSEVTASPFAHQIAAQTSGKDPRIIEVILRETTRIIKMDRGHLIVETGNGWVCANAGVDESNASDPDTVILLPQDPDASAQGLRTELRRRYRIDLAVLITDTFGRPWREGLVDFALGVSGMEALLDLRGETDMDGRELHHTIPAQADALAAAAGLLMRKGAGIPAVHIRGYEFNPAEGSGKALIRDRAMDLFR